MKYILFILFLGASVISSAIDNSSQKPRVNPYTSDVAFQRMQVDPERAEQVKKILIENRIKRREIMEAARQQVNSLKAESEQQIADILTDEEWRAYDQAMDAQQQVFQKLKHWRKLNPERYTTAQTAIENDLPEL